MSLCNERLVSTQIARSLHGRGVTSLGAEEEAGKSRIKAERTVSSKMVIVETSKDSSASLRTLQSCC